MKLNILYILPNIKNYANQMKKIEEFEFLKVDDNYHQLAIKLEIDNLFISVDLISEDSLELRQLVKIYCKVFF